MFARFLAFLLIVTTLPLGYAFAEPSHALALHGTPKYQADFNHFDYVNPDAPKGGSLKLAAQGTFDTLHPFILKGIAASGLQDYLYQSLTVSSLDEPFTQYGQIAKTIDLVKDKSAVTFTLRDNARWHDGKPITAEDVAWTFKTLREKGHPFYRSYYQAVKDIAVQSEKVITFQFVDGTNSELPLIVGQMPVLPKHYWQDRDFAETTLDPPLGSGPYRIAAIETGRKITYQKVDDWWGVELPVNTGRYNFDTIEIDYYRDATVALEALLSNQYDIRVENVAKQWQTAYDHPAANSGKLKKEIINHDIPVGMQAFIFNSRRDMFSDPKVREALGYAFDFEWSNQKFAYGSYKRTNSYFENSELAAHELPSKAELKLLEPYRDQLPSELFTQIYKAPETDGSGNNRQNMRQALSLLKSAGWQTDNGVLVKDGQPFSFEIIIVSPAMERWILPFIRNLEKLGIKVTLRVVDTAQYQARLDSFDFDMTVSVFGQSLSPGNEQYDYWGSEKAEVNGSRNLIGVKNPVVDALIKEIVTAKSREELVTATRALDRVLLWNHYVIPQWHIDYFRVAYWDKFGRPEINPPYGLPVESTWWVKPKN